MSKKCILCRSSAVNELQLGPMHSRGNINVHEYCLVCQNYDIQQQQIYYKQLTNTFHLSAVFEFGSSSTRQWRKWNIGFRS